MVTTKEHALDKKKGTEIMDSFLAQFQNCCNQKRPPNATDFERHLSHNFQNSCNGKLVGKNLQDFLNRVQGLQKRYSHVEIASRQDCLISGNKAIVQYDIDLTSHSGNRTQLNIIAIATIEDHLITQWSQVAHDKGADQFSS